MFNRYLLLILMPAVLADGIMASSVSFSEMTLSPRSRIRYIGGMSPSAAVEGIRELERILPGVRHRIDRQGRQFDPRSARELDPAIAIQMADYLYAHLPNGSPFKDEAFQMRRHLDGSGDIRIKVFHEWRPYLEHADALSAWEDGTLHLYISGGFMMPEQGPLSPWQIRALFGLFYAYYESAVLGGGINKVGVIGMILKAQHRMTIYQEGRLAQDLKDVLPPDLRHPILSPLTVWELTDADNTVLEGLKRESPALWHVLNQMFGNTPVLGAARDYTNAVTAEIDRQMRLIKESRHTRLIDWAGNDIAHLDLKTEDIRQLRAWHLHSIDDLIRRNKQGLLGRGFSVDQIERIDAALNSFGLSIGRFCPDFSPAVGDETLIMSFLTIGGVFPKLS